MQLSLPALISSRTILIKLFLPSRVLAVWIIKRLIDLFPQIYQPVNPF